MDRCTNFKTSPFPNVWIRNPMSGGSNPPIATNYFKVLWQPPAPIFISRIEQTTLLATLARTKSPLMPLIFMILLQILQVYL